MSMSFSLPKYMKVRNSIQESIQNETLPSKSRLASIAKMSVHFGVSPSVIQRALNELVNDGFVECRGASGYYVSNKKINRKPVEENTADKQKNSDNCTVPVYFACAHHSDLVWRKTYEEADETRRDQTERLIEIAEKNPEFHFYFEQAEIPVRLPEFKDRLNKLLENGQAEMIGGTAIPDLNMISGETFLRILLQGKDDYKKIFGIVPDIACLSDAFGMPIQVPQVLSLCGYRYLVPGRMPNPPASLDIQKPFYWDGANKTSILVSEPVYLNDIAYTTNVPVMYDKETYTRQKLERLVSDSENRFAVFYKEEGLFDESICQIVDQVNRSGMREIRFGSLQEYFEMHSSGEHPRYIGEFNPIFTGCYSTRIKNKQMIRKAEIMMRRAETLAAAEGKTLDISELQKELFRVAFHDSLCGCCTDDAQEGIQKKFSNILSGLEKLCVPPKKKRKTFFIANTSSVQGNQLVCSESAPKGIPAQQIDGNYYYFADMPAVGGKNFQEGTPNGGVKDVKEKKIRTAFFTVDFSEKYPKFTCPDNVFGDTFSAVTIRPDFGSMWTERYKEAVLDEKYSCEEPYTITDGPVFYQASTSGKIVPETVQIGHTNKPWNGFKSLSWKKDFYFPKSQDYFFLKLTLNFTGCNTKILVNFPHQLDPFTLERTDSVPFGSLSRKPYFETESRYESTMCSMDSSTYLYAGGDWPILDWTDFSDRRTGLAIANNGIPGCWASGSKITFSLCRSGTAVEDGAMEAGPGGYDNGVHEYWFAFRVHKPGELWKAAELGNILNRMPSESRPLPEGEWLSWDRKNIELSSAEKKGNSLILRFYEFYGKRSDVTLSGAWIDDADIVEIMPTGDKICDVQKNKITFAPFEIKTLMVTPKIKKK